MGAPESKQAATGQTTPVVFVVDDDISVRESLELLIRSGGWCPETFPSAREFLARPRILAPSCLLLDIHLPDLNGLDLQESVAVDRIDMPIIFITGYGDVPMTVRAMKAGAVEVLTKPFRDDVLLRAIRDAIDRSRAALHDEVEMRALREHYASLSGTGGHGALEQAGRRQARHQRDHGEGAPRQGDEKDEGRLAR